jgi:hypothetical protein
MSERIKQIYVSKKTLRRLYWLQNLSKQTCGNITDAEGNVRAMITVDEIADNILNKWIETEHPNIAKLEKRLNALEDQLVIELLNSK